MANAEQNLIEFSRRVLGVQTGGSEAAIIDDVSLEVARGKEKTLVLLGAERGAGKTTLLKLINGMHWPSKGEVGWCGGTGDTGVGRDSIATRDWLRDSGRRDCFPHFYSLRRMWGWCRGLGKLAEGEDWRGEVKEDAAAWSGWEPGEFCAKGKPRELSGGQRPSVWELRGAIGGRTRPFC